MKNDGIFGELRNFGKVRFLMSSLHIYYSWAQGFIEGSDNAGTKLQNLQISSFKCNGVRFSVLSLFMYVCM